MIGWFRRLFRRPRVKDTNVSEFIDRQRASRAAALQVQKESQHTTRMLKQAHPYETDLIGRLNTQKGGHDA